MEQRLVAHNQNLWKTMIVDDEPFIREVLKDLLTHLGVQPIAAASGTQALEMFSALGGDVDLVILDLIMPEKNGLETFHALKKIKDDVKVIVISGNIDKAGMAGFTKSNVKGVLQKPFDVERITRLIMKALSAPRAADLSLPY